MKLTKPFIAFFKSEQFSSVLLAAATLMAIALANSAAGPAISDFWHQKIGATLGPISLKLSIEHWINDGLMTLFFLMIGLEIEREVYIGELSRPRNALLPVLAAAGGMLVPAAIYLALNAGAATRSGFGIPMATDIAFALAVIAALGRRVPPALKVFLTALAIIDDLGAIIVIALFYSGTVAWVFLGLVMLMLALMIWMNHRRVHTLWAYLVPGVLMWVFMLQSGVHATLAGVLLAFAIPFDGGKEHSPSNRLLHMLHKPVAYVIMPIFALANSGIVIGEDWLMSLGRASSLGIVFGLMLGKPLGIFAATFLAVKARLVALPAGLGWGHIAGAGCVAGIGFTMAIFIATLSSNDTSLIQRGKLAIVAGSLASAFIGSAVLSLVARQKPAETAAA